MAFHHIFFRFIVPKFEGLFFLNLVIFIIKFDLNLVIIISKFDFLLFLNLGIFYFLWDIFILKFWKFIFNHLLFFFSNF